MQSCAIRLQRVRVLPYNISCSFGKPRSNTSDFPASIGTAPIAIVGTGPRRQFSTTSTLVHDFNKHIRPLPVPLTSLSIHRPHSHQSFHPLHLKPANTALSNHTMTTPVTSLVESAKRLAAYRAVDEHFPTPTADSTSPLLIGIGSGSTVIYVVERILQLPSSLLSQCIFVPTGYQSRQLILSGNLTLGDIDSHNDLLVAFDGADEVDPSLNCIKGGGACLFQEKLVAVKARKFVVVADFRKISNSLSTTYLPGIPIEVVPPSVSWVTKRLVELGAVNPTLRMGGTAKAGPCVTDNGNFIIDASFSDGVVIEGAGGQVNGAGVGDTLAVEKLADLIKATVGVVEHGIFCKGNAKPVISYFGMQDGSVTTRPEGL